MNTVVPEGKLLIQFDGMCMLCSRTIRLIMKVDRKKKFVFQAIQNSVAIKPIDTVIVSDGNRIYTHFDAFLKIGKELGGIYRTVVLFKVIPRTWRHLLYLWIARNRYHWFGVRKTCYLPTEKDKDRFI